MHKLGVVAGEMITIETRRGSISIMARADKAVSDDMVFVPFAYVEAAANILTNPQVDPYGKIPEFKFAACRVSKPSAVAAE
jgi:formate dehydrogenase major subunit